MLTDFGRGRAKASNSPILLSLSSLLARGSSNWSTQLYNFIQSTQSHLQVVITYDILLQALLPSGALGRRLSVGSILIVVSVVIAHFLVFVIFLRDNTEVFNV